MSEVFEKAAEVLLAHGPLGVVALAQGYWIWKLHGQLSVAQEKRVQDAYRLAETITSCTSAIERSTEVLNAMLKS